MIPNSAASALSPSGHLLAVVDLNDGIGWYCMKERIFLSSTTYESPANYTYVAGIDFVDERTVVVGNSGGRLIFAAHGRGANPPYLTLNQQKGAEGKRLYCCKMGPN